MPSKTAAPPSESAALNAQTAALPAKSAAFQSETAAPQAESAALPSETAALDPFDPIDPKDPNSPALTKPLREYPPRRSRVAKRCPSRGAPRPVIVRGRVPKSSQRGERFSRPKRSVLAASSLIQLGARIAGADRRRPREYPPRRQASPTGRLRGVQTQPPQNATRAEGIPSPKATRRAH